MSTVLLERVLAVVFQAASRVFSASSMLRRSMSISCGYVYFLFGVCGNAVDEVGFLNGLAVRYRGDFASAAKAENASAVRYSTRWRARLYVRSGFHRLGTRRIPRRPLFLHNVGALFMLIWELPWGELFPRTFTKHLLYQEGSTRPAWWCLSGAFCNSRLLCVRFRV